MDKDSLAFLAKLVGAKSVSSKHAATDVSNQQASEVVAEMLRAHGFAVELQAVPGLRDKCNVVGSMGPATPGEGLLLAGHTDTVPFVAADWSTGDPLELKTQDGRCYGMGACDMKGFFAVIDAALRLLGADALGQLKRPLRVWATAEEECGMEGARHLAQTAVPSKYALLGEPTRLRPVYAHKGSVNEVVTCTGRAAHASDPSQGASALEGVVRIMGALQADLARTADQSADEAFTPPQGTLNFGRCQAGVAPNTVPAHAELTVDRRLMPGESGDEVQERMRAVMREAVEEIEGVEIEFQATGFQLRPMSTPVDSEIVAYAAELAGCAPETAPYGTEAPYYAGAGMEVVVMGAGSIEQAHQADEYVAIEQLERMAEMTACMIKRFCCS